MDGRRGAPCVVVCFAATLICGVAAAQKGSLSGVVIETFDSGDGPPSLLVTVGRAGDPPVSELRVDLGKKAARDCRTTVTPTGWQLESKGGTVVVSGPATPAPVFVRLEPSGVVVPPGPVKVGVISNGDRVFDSRVAISYRGEAFPEPDAVGDLIVLPPAAMPGERVTATVVDPGRARVEGRWRVGDVDGSSETTRGPDESYTVTFEIPGDVGPGEPIELIYVDPFGETTVATDISSDVNILPPTDTEAPPRIDGGQRYVFLGETGCVCGFFPTEASRRGLVVGGLPIGEPVAASSSSVVFRLPEGLTPGEHLVSTDPSTGFQPAAEHKIIVLGLSGSIDQELLMRGQSTPMQIVVEGTEEPLELRLTNTTPQVISLEGGEEGVVTTSGGSPNTVERIVHGIRRGDFNVAYEMANDPCPCGPEGSGSVSDDDSPLQTGYPVPDGVTLGAPRGTGRTTGHIADLTVTNNGDRPITFPDRPVYVPGSGKYQSYVIPGGGGTTVPPGETRTVPLEGYCGDVRKPPVPDGEPLPDPSEWTVPRDPTTPLPAPGDPGYEKLPDEGKIISGTEEIIRVTEELQEGGELETPFSSNPEREAETVKQQTIWRYTSELEGEPYTKEEFTERIEEQYEERTGTPVESAPEEDRERLEEGIDDFWDAFELVGTEAKVVGHEEETPTTTTPESVPVTTEEPPCDIGRTMNHTEADSDFKMSESYKDEDKRANLKQWFGDLPEIADTTEGGTFEANKYPASAWAVAGRDFIGGYSNAVAKHIYLEAGGGTDWVWSTELLKVDAKSKGTHTMTVTPPPGKECETLVVGAAGGVVEAWSNAIDPIANNRGLIEALRWVRDSAIIVASVALAPATAGASLAVGFGTMVATKAFASEFTSNANAGAAAEGQMILWVGERQLPLVADSRSEVAGDGKITSDGQKTTVGQISDTHPTTLSANTHGLSAVKGEADDNGIAEATLESQVGVAMVAFCRCGGGVQIEYLTDAGLFLVDKGAAGAATRAAAKLEEMLGKEIDPYLEMPPEEVIPKAKEKLPKDLEKMLRDWYLENGSDPGKTGYFGATSGGD
jgi:hypothetical protein